MELTTFIYLASVVSKLGGIAGFWGFLLSIIIIINTIALIIVSLFATDGDSDAKKALPEISKYWKIFVTLGSFFGFIYVVTPTSNTMYAMAAAKIGEQIANRPDVQNLTSDATKALQQWIKKQISEDEKKKD